MPEPRKKVRAPDVRVGDAIIEPSSLPPEFTPNLPPEFVPDQPADPPPEPPPPSVQAPATGLEDMVDYAQRTGEFTSPGYSGINFGGQRRVNYPVAASLSALDTMTGGASPDLQALIASAISGTPLSEARNRTYTEREVAERGLPGATTTGRVGGTMALGAIPLVGPALALTMPAAATYTEALRHGATEEEARKKALVELSLGSALVGGGAAVSAAGKPALRMGTRLLDEIAPSVMGAARNAGAAAASPFRKAYGAVDEFISGLGRGTPAAEQGAKQVAESVPRTQTPESQRFWEAINKAKAEDQASNLQAARSASMHQAEQAGEEMATAAGRRGARPVAEPSTDVMTGPAFAKTEAAPVQAARSTSTASPTPPATANPEPRLSDNRAIQNVERVLRGSLAGSIGLSPGAGHVMQALATGIGGSVFGPQHPVLTAASSFLGGGLARALGKTAQKTGAAAARVSTAREPDAPRFAAFALKNPKLREEALTVLRNAKTSLDSSRAHRTLMERSPRYREEYMKWAATNQESSR